MKRLNAHSKLLGLLYLMLIFGTSLGVLAGCGGVLVDEPLDIGGSVQNYDQVADAFSRIVPGMTNAQDLPNLGFDPKTAKADTLTYVDIENRFMAAPGLASERLDPAVKACIRAEVYCSGYEFHQSRKTNNRLAALVRFGPMHDGGWSVTFLMMNGRVVYKVLSTQSSQDPDHAKRPKAFLQI
jgi:hypothetical protein